MRLIEHYLSIQGEGLHPGKLTYFVRFARCNLRCAWCDSAYTFGEGTEIKFESVAEAIYKSRAKFVCLTGGEPLLYPADCIQLIQHFSQPRPLPAGSSVKDSQFGRWGVHFDIETGGSIKISPVQFPNSSVIMDWKLSHSGMNHQMKEENLFLLRPEKDLLKFVTDGSEEELKEIEELLARTESLKVPISIQPVFGTDPKKLAEWVIHTKNPRLQVNLQIHKYIWSENAVGV